MIIFIGHSENDTSTLRRNRSVLSYQGLGVMKCIVPLFPNVLRCFSSSKLRMQESKNHRILCSKDIKDQKEKEMSLKEFRKKKLKVSSKISRWHILLRCS